MNLTEQITMKGELTITLRDENGFIKETRKIPNLVVTVGKNYIASRMIGAAATVMGWMELGTGVVSPVVGDTTLGSPAGRVALSALTNPGSVNIVQATATFPAGTATGAITEAGIFNAASVGTLLCRTTFSVVNKGALDSLAVTWAITVS